MSAISKLLTTTQRPSSLRAFDPRRDLSRVADLVELCFADTLDQEGHNYLRQMRSAARNPSYLRWAGLMSERSSLPLSGYVWEEDDRLVGNLTLIPHTALNHLYYLIANVAVHPDYRRRGIARSLTAAAIDYARRRGIQTVWLHVRAENQAAGDLYRSLGFVQRASRTTWHSSSQGTADILQPAGSSLTPDGGIHITPRRGADWSVQRFWLSKLYPPAVTWHLPLRVSAVRPGIRGFFYRMINDMQVAQWTALRENRLAGVITLQASPGYADLLWLAVNPNGDESAIAPLLVHARQHSIPRRTLMLDYPAGESIQSIEAAGFHEHQTLVWMSLDLDKLTKTHQNGG